MVIKTGKVINNDILKIVHTNETIFAINVLI